MKSTKNLNTIDYKDIKEMQRLITANGSIEVRKRNKVNLKTQRKLALAIKRARHLALLPYVIK